MKHWTLTEIKAANSKAGFHFFDPDTMRFFRSQIGKLYQGIGGVFLVTSEQFSSYSWRGYTIRQVTPATGDVNTVDGCPFNEWTASKANYWAEKLAKGDRLPVEADLKE